MESDFELFPFDAIIFAVTFAFVSYIGVSVVLSTSMVFQIRERLSVTLMGLL